MRLNRTWHNTRFQGAKILRLKYPEEFARLLNAQRSNAGMRGNICYSRAQTRLMQLHREEFVAIMQALHPTKVNLVKGKRKHSGPRNDIDARDAVILFERGMTAAQIARYDNCTLEAVLNVLVPILAAQRSRQAPWFATPVVAGVAEVAGKLCVRAETVEKVLAAV